MEALEPETVPPATVGRADVEAAAIRIADRIRHTPVIELEPGAFGVPGRIILKLELLQHTGSFKARGAFNKMLASDVGDAGVIAASGGNFGLAVAFAARELGHRAEIFVPDSSPPVKADRIRDQGADVRVVPGYFAEAYAAMTERAATTGAILMHPYDQPEVVAGQGTIGAELSEQAPGADTVLAAVGGGGRGAGLAAGYDGDARVVAVEPAACPSMQVALETGHPVQVEVGGVAADSLGPARLGDIAFEITKRLVDGPIVVTDDDIIGAQRALWQRTRMVAEPGGATALAALLSGGYRPESGEQVVVLVCGANADLGFLTD
jgi:threonine dehydratase